MRGRPRIPLRMSKEEILDLFLNKRVSVAVLARINGVGYNTMKRRLIEWLGEEKYREVIHSNTHM